MWCTLNADFSYKNIYVSYIIVSWELRAMSMFLLSHDLGCTMCFILNTGYYYTVYIRVDQKSSEVSSLMADLRCFTSRITKKNLCVRRKTSKDFGLPCMDGVTFFYFLLSRAGHRIYPTGGLISSYRVNIFFIYLFTVSLTLNFFFLAGR